MITLQDRADIQDVYARYNFAVDSGDVEAWLALFTEDALFEATKPYRGRSGLRDFIVEYGSEQREPDLHEEHHLNSNLLLEQERDHVRGRCYLLRLARTRAGDDIRLMRAATYDDQLVKVDGAWLFRQRTVHFTMPRVPPGPLEAAR